MFLFDNAVLQHIKIKNIYSIFTMLLRNKSIIFYDEAIIDKITEHSYFVKN